MLFLFTFFIHQLPIDRLDQLAQARDVSELTKFLASSGGPNPFTILSTGGGYAVGEMGWHARLLQPKDGTAKYVVFTTPTLEEDAGELLFRINTQNKLAFVPERDDMGVLLDSHSFDVKFDLPAHRVSVIDRLKVHWAGAPRPQFVFRFSPTLKVTQISDASGNQVPFVQAGGVVAVSPRGGEKEFDVAYSGAIRTPGFANVLGPAEATLSGSMWYPMIARRPATYDITIHSPSDWLAVAQGEEESSSVVAGERITTYRMNLPVVWFSATTGPYRRVTTRIDGIDFSTITENTRITDDAMREQNETNASVIGFYSKTFGPYPFKSWTTIDSRQFQQGVGALEGYSFATYPAGRLPFRDTHEPSHTWWGGIINNDYLASIWNESFADYSQVIINRDRPVGDMEERRRAFSTEGFNTPLFDAAPLARSGQDIGPPATALGYAKGAYVLEVLDDELGTPTFLRALRDWVRTNPARHIGSWEDFEKVVDRVSGRDMTWFFDEWMRGTGLPDFTLSSGSWNDGEFRGQVEFKGAPYRIETDAVLEFGDGSRSFARVSIDPAKQSRFAIECARKPTVVALDPWQIIPRRNGRLARFNGIQEFRRDTVFVDPTKPQYMKALIRAKPSDAIPADLDGVFLVGSPETTASLGPLCEKVGFHVNGDRLTFKGTTIDLRTEGAVAIVDLAGGKRCMIGLGRCDRLPNFGRARLALLNADGDLLRSQTDPIETGPLSIRL